MSGHAFVRRILLFLLLMEVLSCTEVGLNDYCAQNNDQRLILQRLIAYQEARNNFDLEGYLDCLHDQGTFHFACRQMLSKSELKERLPSFWAKLRAGNPEIFPMTRENMSGNYFLSGRLINPVLHINHHTAYVTVLYVYKGWRLKHYLTLQRVEDRWLISKLDWETG